MGAMAGGYTTPAEKHLTSNFALKALQSKQVVT
jgi:hypothetical protein